MKTTKLIILLISIILIETILNGITTCNNIKFRDQIKTQTENVEQLIVQNNQNKTLYLTKDQFGVILQNENKKLLKRLYDSLNVKTKNIVRTFNNSYNYHYKDTVIFPEKKDSVYFTTYKPDACMKVDVKFRLSDEAFLFSDPEINYQSETLYYWQRQNKKGKKRPWPWKKHFTSATINNCKGQTITTEINILKK